MKKFRYRLQPLLDIRAHAEKERQKAHALSLQQVQDQTQQLVGIAAGREETLDHQREIQSRSLSLAELLVCSRYLLKLKKDTLAGQELLRALQREAEKKRTELVEASKERKVFEKLKEKQQERYYKAAEAEERKEADEIANTSYLRKDVR
jgi:flagellar FliJ protein